jgi:tRNA-dihydrouridine synthase
MGEIASSKYLEKFDIIDINMGCPVPKIYNNGEGSALLNDLNLASKIILLVFLVLFIAVVLKEVIL